MSKYILVESYHYDMSNSVYEDYQPIKKCRFYDEIEKAENDLEDLKNKFHNKYGQHEFWTLTYRLQEDCSYYSEKYDEIIYPPKLYTVKE